MRSKKPELEDVGDQFEAWRAKPHGRLIPAELWKAALGLLDRYSASTICGHLRLNAGRFKQMRESRGVVVEQRRRIGRRRSGASVRGPRKLLHRSSASEQITTLASGRNAFLELPPLGVGGGIMTPRLREAERVPAGFRLTLESAFGTLSVVTSRSSEEALAEAVCRVVLGALTDSSRT